MAIKSPTALVYHINNLSIKTLHDLLKIIRRTNQPILIDVDCFWLAFKLGGSKNPDEAVHKVADFLQRLASYGFIVTPVCDGEQQHHSKRASTKQVANVEKH